MINVVGHHSLTKDGKVKDFVALKYYHITTLLMLDIGYHYVIEDINDVVVTLKGRQEGRQGAHTKGFNEGTIGVCWVGNYDVTELPNDMYEEGIKLLDELAERHGGIYFTGHCDHPHPVTKYRKTCPGKNFPLDKIKALYNPTGYRISKLVTLESLEDRVMKIEEKLGMPHGVVDIPVISSSPLTSNYEVISTTHVVTLDPMDLKIKINPTSGKKIVVSNWVNACFIGNHPDGKAYGTSMLVSEGKILNNMQPNGLYHGEYKGRGAPTPTFMVYEDGSVAMRVTNDITKEEKRVRFAVSGVQVFPKVSKEGFEGYVPFSSVAYACNRIGIGYNLETGKVVLVFRPNTSVERLGITMKNLGCNFGLSLDSGGSANYIVNGKKINATSRETYAGIVWEG